MKVQHGADQIRDGISCLLSIGLKSGVYLLLRIEGE